MFTPPSASARKHCPRAPDLSGIVTVNSFALAMWLDSLSIQGAGKQQNKKRFYALTEFLISLFLEMGRPDSERDARQVFASRYSPGLTVAEAPTIVCLL